MSAVRKPAQRGPGHWEICDVCNGEGRSSAYMGVVSQEFLDDCEDDNGFFPEDEEDEDGNLPPVATRSRRSSNAYLRGDYDHECTHCQDGKVWVADDEDGEEGEQEPVIIRSGPNGEQMIYRDADDASEHWLHVAEGRY